MKDKPLDRKSLNSLFSEGSRPNAENFESLIESMINKVDDRISKDIKDGLILASENDEPDIKNPERLLSFKRHILDSLPAWSFDMENESREGLNLVETLSENESESRLFFKKGGNIGINTTTPRTTLEVDGVLGINTKVGTFQLATIPADGAWHDIVTDIKGCNGFEIVAQVGKEKTGRYALMQATALSTFGKSRSKIKSVQAHYNCWWWNKLAMRWNGNTYNYKLQLRTRSNYGPDTTIKYHITNIWSSEVLSLFNENE